MPYHYFLAKPSEKTSKKPRLANCKESFNGTLEDQSSNHSQYRNSHIGGMTYGYAGGGYKGATQELDDAVVRESELMANEFKKPI